MSFRTWLLSAEGDKELKALTRVMPAIEAERILAAAWNGAIAQTWNFLRELHTEFK